MNKSNSCRHPSVILRPAPSIQICICTKERPLNILTSVHSLLTPLENKNKGWWMSYPNNQLFWSFPLGFGMIFYPLLSLGGVRNNCQVPSGVFSEMKLLMTPSLYLFIYFFFTFEPWVLWCSWYPRVAAWAHHPDPKATCWLGQGSTAVIRCCFQFLSLKRSGQTFQCYSKAASLSFYFFSPY